MGTVSLRDGEGRAEITIQGPPEGEPTDPEGMRAAGASQWNLRVFRELDDALLRLRFHHTELGLWVLRTRGSAERVLTLDEALVRHQDFWLAREMTLLRARTLRRLDLSARSLFALIEEDSCFAGSLLELALAADRSFMFDDEDGTVTVRTSEMNAGTLPMTHGSTRMQSRFAGNEERVASVMAADHPFDARQSEELGLVTFALDDIDWEDDVRVALEERASMSPDALTGMEASLRFSGPENMESKVFARLSAWQNWVFIRPNATGERGALTCYGKPERPEFDTERC